MADNAALTTHHVACLIDRLPTELLTLLFRFALFLAPRSSVRSNDLDHDGCFLYYKQLSLIGLVCRKWQRIVETNSSFWIHISASIPPPLFEKVVERAAKTESLFVHYKAPASFPPPSQREAADRILQLSRFWTSLHTQFANPDQLFQLLRQPTPRLHTLHVEDTGRYGTYKDAESGFQTISFPLEILKVKDSTFPWSLSAITDLLDIDVECYYGCPYFSQGFIDVLRSSPRLQSLRLSFCRTDFQLQTNIDLPHLKSIDVAYSPEAAGLLNAITCPSSTKISICESTQFLTTQNLWVAAALNHANFKCTDKVHLVLRPRNEVGVRVGNINVALQPSSMGFDLVSVLDFCTDILKPFSDTSGAQVTTLELGLDLEWNVAPLLSKLDSFFPNISSLELYGYAEDLHYSKLYNALSKPFVKGDGEGRWLLPNVEELRIHDKAGPGFPVTGVMGITRPRCSSPDPSEDDEDDLYTYYF